MRIKKNPNQKFVEEMRQSIKDADGHCPCRVDRTPDTKCMCKEFRDQVDQHITGWCHCKLYYAEEDE